MFPFSNELVHTSCSKYSSLLLHVLIYFKRQILLFCNLYKPDFIHFRVDNYHRWRTCYVTHTVFVKLYFHFLCHDIALQTILHHSYRYVFVALTLFLILSQWLQRFWIFGMLLLPLFAAFFENCNIF